MKRSCLALSPVLVAIWANTAQATLAFYLGGSPAGPLALYGIGSPMPTIGIHSTVAGARSGRVLERSMSTHLRNPRGDPSVVGPNEVLFNPVGGEYFSRGYSFTTWPAAQAGLQMYMDLVAPASAPDLVTLTAWRDENVFNVPDDLFYIYRGGAPGFYPDWIEFHLGGPYQIGPGQTIPLDATASIFHAIDYGGQPFHMPMGEATSSYWLVNGVKVAFYAQTTLDYNDLITGLHLGPGTYQLTLQVEDFFFHGSASTTVQIVPEPNVWWFGTTALSCALCCRRRHAA